MTRNLAWRNRDSLYERRWEIKTVWKCAAGMRQLQNTINSNEILKEIRSKGVTGKFSRALELINIHSMVDNENPVEPSIFEKQLLVIY